MNNIKFNYCKTSLPETLEIGWVYFVEPEQKFYVVNDAGEPINYTGMSKDEEDVIAATLIALQKEKLGEDEEYVISKALNDLNERINNIDVTDQINAMKNDIEQNSLWKSDNYNIYTSKLNASASYDAVAIGYEARAENGYGIAIGEEAIATDYEGVAIGRYSTAGYDSVAIGERSNAAQMYSVAIGPNAVASEEYPFVLKHSYVNYTFRNQILQKQDGSLYIRGIGNWNGDTPGKSLQEVLEDMSYVTASALTDLDSRVKVLETPSEEVVYKTVNGESILGEGNIEVVTQTTYNNYVTSTNTALSAANTKIDNGLSWNII